MGEIVDDQFGHYDHLWGSDGKDLDDEHPDASWDFGLVFGGPAGSEKRVRCNRCGSTKVRWCQQGDRWVLFNFGEDRHVCSIDDSSFKAIDP